MRSFLSNRYNNKSKQFYERYEAARALHPSLPLYERPKEPNQLETIDRSCRRRFKSYQELNKQSTEKHNSTDWLTSDQLSIVVRRQLEMRNNVSLMPKYDPTEANHEFSHTAKIRQRGRRPNAATVAKMESDFAEQVGGLPIKQKANQDGVNEGQDLEKFEVMNQGPDLEKSEVVNEGGPDLEKSEVVNEGQDLENSGVKSQFIEINLQEEVENVEKVEDPLPSPEEAVEQVKPNNTYKLIDINKLQLPKLKGLPNLKRELVPEEKENMPVEKQYKFTMPPRIFICPEASCKEEFALRRFLTKHQKATGHHTWAHKCDRCGQIFRTAGFMRMHTPGACDRNRQKSLKHAFLPGQFIHL